MTDDTWAREKAEIIATDLDHYFWDRGKAVLWFAKAISSARAKGRAEGRTIGMARAAAIVDNEPLCGSAIEQRMMAAMAIRDKYQLSAEQTGGVASKNAKGDSSLPERSIENASLRNTGPHPRPAPTEQDDPEFLIRPPFHQPTKRNEEVMPNTAQEPDETGTQRRDTKSAPVEPLAAVGERRKK